MRQAAAAEEVHVAEIGLRVGQALVGGFAVPFDGFDVVARETILALGVFDAELVLRRRIAAIGRSDNVGERTGQSCGIARARRTRRRRRRARCRLSSRRLQRERRRDDGRWRRGRLRDHRWRRRRR